MSEQFTEVDFERKHIQRLQSERDELRRKYENAIARGDRMAFKVEEAEQIVKEVRRSLPEASEERRKLLVAETLLGMALIDASKASADDNQPPSTEWRAPSFGVERLAEPDPIRGVGEL